MLDGEYGDGDTVPCCGPPYFTTRLTFPHDTNGKSDIRGWGGRSYLLPRGGG